MIVYTFNYNYGLFEKSYLLNTFEKDYKVNITILYQALIGRQLAVLYMKV